VRLNRQIGLDSEEAGECASLLIGELTAEAFRIEDGLTLRNRHLADIAEGAGYQSAAIHWQIAELLHRPTKLLTLLRRETLHDLGALEESAALLRRHAIELAQVVAHPLLGLRRQVAEAGFPFQGTLLLLQGEVAVMVHPLAEMLLLRLWHVALRGWALGEGRSLWRSPGLCQKHHSRRKEACRRENSAKGNPG